MIQLLKTVISKIIVATTSIIQKKACSAVFKLAWSQNSKFCVLFTDAHNKVYYVIGLCSCLLFITQHFDCNLIAKEV